MNGFKSTLWDSQWFPNGSVRVEIICPHNSAVFESSREKEKKKLIDTLIHVKIKLDRIFIDI